QHTHHHLRMIGRRPQARGIAGHDPAQVQALAHQRHHEAGEMVLAYVVLHASRQQLLFVDLPGAKVFAHGPGQNPTRRRKSSNYSDRLLVGVSQSANSPRSFTWRVHIRTIKAWSITSSSIPSSWVAHRRRWICKPSI